MSVIDIDDADALRIAADVLQERGIRLRKEVLAMLLADERSDEDVFQPADSDEDCLAFRRDLDLVLDPKRDWQAADRKIICTPIFGSYHKVAYWAIVLNGSPPKGTVLVQTGWNAQVIPRLGYPAAIFIDSSGTSRRLRSDRAAHTVNRLLAMLGCAMLVPALVSRMFEVRQDGRVVVCTNLYPYPY